MDLKQISPSYHPAYTWLWNTEVKAGIRLECIDIFPRYSGFQI